MRTVDRSRYGAPMRHLVEDLFARALPSDLVFGRPDGDVRDRLAKLTNEALGDGRPVRDAEAAAAVRAGLWWAYDHMDESHGIAQDLDDARGAYWHALVHRREPDPGNARYWFGRVRSHPIWAELLADARELLADAPGDLQRLSKGGSFRPEVMVDLCAATPRGAARDRLLLLQRREWELLLDHDWTIAFEERG